MSAVTAAAWEGEAVGPGVRVEKSFHQGYPGMQEGKRERKGLKIPDKREMKEGGSVFHSSLLVGLSKDVLV